MVGETSFYCVEQNKMYFIKGSFSTMFRYSDVCWTLNLNIRMQMSMATYIKLKSLVPNIAPTYRIWQGQACYMYYNYNKSTMGHVLKSDMVTPLNWIKWMESPALLLPGSNTNKKLKTETLTWYMVLFFLERKGQ